MSKKHLLFSLIIFLALFVFMEAFIGNLNFRRQHPGQLSATWYKIDKKFISPVKSLFNKDDFSKSIDTDINPWTNYPTQPGLRLHPFIDSNSNNLCGKMAPLKPDVLWAQREDSIFLTIDLKLTMVVKKGTS